MSAHFFSRSGTAGGRGVRALRLALIGAALLAGSGGAQAQDQVWPPAGVSFNGDPSVTDMSGLWMGTVMSQPGQPAENNMRQTADGSPTISWSPWPLPYNDEYQKISDDRIAATKKGVALGDIGSRCLPFGQPYLLTSMNFPLEIVQTPGQTTLFLFGTFPLTIWTDGRPHPADWKPSYNGHSTGYWLGDTLFVDTIGILPTTALDGMRNPHSGKIRLSWSLRKVSADILHLHMTVFDEGALKEPITITNIMHRKTDRKWEVLDDASCFENNTHISEKPAEPGFIKF